MSQKSDIVNKRLTELQKEIVVHYKAKGMMASGQFERTIYTEADDKGGAIFAEDYSDQLEKGREPTTGGGDGTLLQKITQWVKDKSIRATDISESSLIFLITRKIHREGWKRQGYGGVELLSEVLTDKRINKLLDDISNDFYDIYIKEITKQFETI